MASGIMGRQPEKNSGFPSKKWIADVVAKLVAPVFWPVTAFVETITEHKPLRLAVKKACQAVCASPSGYFKNLKKPSASQQYKSSQYIIKLTSPEGEGFQPALKETINPACPILICLSVHPVSASPERDNKSGLPDPDLSVHPSSFSQPRKRQ